MIKFDLHIHSQASSYKEDTDILNQSTKEHVDILLSKLDDNQVCLFSITDHNRFDPELYEEIDRKLFDPKPYKNVKAVLSGVEFDVIIDEAIGKCHIITIFDSKNKPENYKKIADVINNHLLTNKNDSYLKKEFEELLYNIGLNTILIACQRKDINNHNGKHNSLSDSSPDVGEIIKVGFINALEFQKPKVEGILINNLKNLPSQVCLISGSDCHQWSSYPNHDENNKNLEFYHSKANILPTFKGLLMAITSPETRFNCRENPNMIHIDGIKIKDKTVPLVNGINAIIGENGSGKSTLIKLLSSAISEAHVKKLIKDNSLDKENSIDNSKIKYIEQSEVIRKFNNSTLFSSGSETNYKALDNSKFEETYSAFSNTLKDNIRKRIQTKEAVDSLKTYSVQYNFQLEEKSYYIMVSCPIGFGEIANIHEQPLMKIKRVIENIESIEKDSYFTDYLPELLNARSKMHDIKERIQTQWEKIDNESKLKNILVSCVNDYTRLTGEISTAKDREIQEYADKKNKFVDAIVNATKTSSRLIPDEIPPPSIDGNTTSRKKGFYFNRVANYNNLSMIDSFLSHMFNRDYVSLDAIKKINTNQELMLALKNCTNEANIDQKWKENFTKFFADSIDSKDYITNGTGGQVGSTLGEMSLSYYKYSTEDSDNWNVLIIDQPEDNISNYNIKKFLISYFNSIRYSKQLIFVTHNPLLVVNLDVDNVVYVQNDTGDISIKSGCLEYEDTNTNILEVIAQNMDGGKDTIEKRLKVYGKDN